MNPYISTVEEPSKTARKFEKKQSGKWAEVGATILCWNVLQELIKTGKGWLKSTAHVAASSNMLPSEGILTLKKWWIDAGVEGFYKV